MDRPLTYMDGETLMNTVLPPIRFVISQLLPQGLHVLAGAPKVGKSWLSLWLCLQVAKGEPGMGILHYPGRRTLPLSGGQLHPYSKQTVPDHR